MSAGGETFIMYHVPVDVLSAFSSNGKQTGVLVLQKT